MPYARDAQGRGSWTHVGRVPAGDGLDAADVGEPLDLLLGLPAVLGDEAVGAVGAADGREGAGAVVVAGVVGDCEGVSY